MRGFLFIYSFVCLSGCVTSSDNKRFLVDNQQTSPIPAAVYSDIQQQLDSLRAHDTSQERDMGKLGGQIADLNTHLSRSDALINDLVRNRTSCSCSHDINTGNPGLSSPELKNISQQIQIIANDVHQHDLVTSNLSSITGSISRQVSGTYQLLEELISLPAAHELKLELQNSDLHTIFDNIASAHTQSHACKCNVSGLSSQIKTLDQKYQSALLDLNNMKAGISTNDNKLSQQDMTIQTLQQKLYEQDQTLNAKGTILNDMTSQIHKLTLDLNRQQLVIQNLTSEKAAMSTATSSLDDRIQTQAATIQDMSTTLRQQQNFITSLLGWLKDTVQLPCTTGSIHNLCPAGSRDIFFHNQFHETPSVSSAASLFHIPTRAVMNHMTPTIANVTPRGFRITVVCESDSNYAIEATWKACVIPLVEVNSN
ncbi:uncharacterized protein LOC117340825 [Pecten maximus]|uniref:uncharacterized protein LOC117340825 n=1 Tax=Pecten maximus TaxID=6579 RepID=UPI001458C8F6|nr:uncharacterized protein LOC117340825 [Pecten maximus]